MNRPHVRQGDAARSRPATLLSLSTSAWAYPFWTSRQFLTWHLASYYRVLYATERPELRMALAARSEASGVNWPFPPPEGLEIIRPFWPRTFRSGWLDQQFLGAHVRRLQTLLDAGSPERRVVYAWHPSEISTVRGLSYDTLIYHPYDMFRAFEDTTDEFIDIERELVGLADAVITPHQKVAAELDHGNTHVIENGVFLEAFPHFDSVTPSPELARIDGPVIGMFGVVNSKLDFRLLLEVFSEKPEWQLVLAGFQGGGRWRESGDYQEILHLENVRFMQGVPFQQAAQVLAGFDVGLIPFRLAGWARYCGSPLKLYQYWAMGVPVVSSRLPGLTSSPGALEVCDTSESWIRGIERQLACRDRTSREMLRQLAARNDWADRARKVVHAIDSIPIDGGRSK